MGLQEALPEDARDAWRCRESGRAAERGGHVRPGWAGCLVGSCSQGPELKDAKSIFF